MKSMPWATTSATARTPLRTTHGMRRTRSRTAAPRAVGLRRARRRRPRLRRTADWQGLSDQTFGTRSRKTSASTAPWISNDPAYQQQVQANQLQTDRAADRARAAMAQRRAATGTGTSGAVDTDVNKVLEQQAYQDKTFEGNLLDKFRQQDLDQQARALQLGTGMLTAEQERQLRGSVDARRLRRAARHSLRTTRRIGAMRSASSWRSRKRTSISARCCDVARRLSDATTTARDGRCRRPSCGGVGKLFGGAAKGAADERGNVRTSSTTATRPHALGELRHQAGRDAAMRCSPVAETRCRATRPGRARRPTRCKACRARTRRRGSGESNEKIALAKLGLDAPAANAKQSILGSLMKNMQPHSFASPMRPAGAPDQVQRRHVAANSTR